LLPRRTGRAASVRPDPILSDAPPAPQSEEQRVFTIRTVASAEREAASDLLGRRYAWRGYRTVSLPSDQTGYRTTLSAQEGERAIGTLTLELDGPLGLAAEAAFGPEIEALRSQGRRLAEFTRLAVDTNASSQRVLAALFHVGYIVSYRLRRYDTLLLEVNPRHVRFYERMLGCKVIGPVREHPGVKAPAVLLSAEFAYIRDQIRAHGGQGDHVTDARSLYPFAFTASDEAGIIERLLQAQVGSSPLAN
jgi:hypothetical protein